MKYGIWRHEDALGNGAEHVINLAQFLAKNGDRSPEIFVENDWQRCMALCIPGISDDNIRYYPNISHMNFTGPEWKGFKNHRVANRQ